ncbi:MAG: hypothetical protein DMG13_05075 [Acidobacteria bacterium]|nr:MAG: hypothetical protein DMG13_05075 [Acidobacteriota bacterium]
MEDQTTWKGHSFTLLVFTGIVVLCSIFFILGMLVGRAQGQKAAAIVAEGGVPKPEVPPPLKEEKPDLTFFESVEKERQPTLERPKRESVPPLLESAPKPAESAAPTKVINYQIAALRKASDADKLLDSAKRKGFRGFILAPVPGDGSPLYRVQIGPFSNMIEAEQAKKKLESAGYQPILKK